MEQALSSELDGDEDFFNLIDIEDLRGNNSGHGDFHTGQSRISHDSCARSSFAETTEFAAGATAQQPLFLIYTTDHTNVEAETKCKQRLPRTLLETYRPKFFNVSDFVMQSWCGQKAVLSIQHPNFEADMQEIDSLTNVNVKPVIKLGTAIHQKRELEVHKKVIIEVSTSEDRFGVKLLQIHSLLGNLILGKSMEREIPVFGMPLDLGVLIFGIIDEVRLDCSTWELTLSETKTRSVEREPCKSQQVGQKLQIMLYKRLFMDLVQNLVPWKLVLNILRLRGTRGFSASFLVEVKKAGLTAINLDELIVVVIGSIASLPRKILLNLEYVLQSTGKTFLTKIVEYDEGLLTSQMSGFMGAWTGKTIMTGVAPHEAWKCSTCYFADKCPWRLEKIQAAGIAAKKRKKSFNEADV